jgi:hypothetical protein
MHAAAKGHTACVEALVAANAALDIQNVSNARLLACPFTLILCLCAHLVNIVVCYPSPIIFSLGYLVD